MSDEEKEIFNNLKEYMQSKIDNGYHKFIYNDLDWDFKCIDCINAIDNALKQSKEIEELKEDRKKYAEEYIHNNPWLYKQLNENYILRVESEQKERKAYIKGTNDADELCNKKWQDKIKAKIEECEKEKNIIQSEMDFEAFYRIKDLKNIEIEVLQSLLEKE